MGLIDAARLANRLGLFSDENLSRCVSLCEQMGLRFQPPAGLDPEALLALMRHDKKAVQGKIRLILPTDPMGTVMVKDDVPEALIREILSDTIEG
jgi:3-dehydroquinate synthase